LASKVYKRKLKQRYEQLLLDNDGYFPPPYACYENSTFAINFTPMITQPVHELKPYSRKKSKLKYETLDDVGSQIRMFTGIRI
jgi:hypothetical protein